MANTRKGSQNSIGDQEILLKFLLLLARGFPLHEVSRRLGLSVDKINLMVVALLGEGYIIEAGRGLGCVCESCVIKDICGGRTFRSDSKIKSYVLTEKGKALVAKLASRGPKGLEQGSSRR